MRGAIDQLDAREPDRWVVHHDDEDRSVEVVFGNVVGEGTDADLLEQPIGGELEVPPVLVRPGALLSLLSPTVDTLAPYGDAAVRADQTDARHLLAFPNASWAGSLGIGLSATSDVDEDRWVLELTDDVARVLELEADLGLLPDGAPLDVEVEGAISATYDQETGVLTATLSAGRMVVRRVEH